MHLTDRGVRVSTSRVQHHGRREFRERFGLAALPEVHFTELVVRAGVIRNEIDALRECRDGGVVLLLRTGQCANALIHAVEAEQRLRGGGRGELAHRVGEQALALVDQSELVSRATG